MVETVIQPQNGPTMACVAELEHIEKTTADLRDTEIGLQEPPLITKLHPASFPERHRLYGGI